MVRKRKSTIVRKKQIIDAARKLIVKHGSEHITVRGIAKEVNISEAAIYRHFKSKREILSFLANNITDSLLEDINQLADEKFTSLEAINDILEGHLSSIEQRRGMSFQVIAEIISLGDKKLNWQVTQSIDEYVDRLKALLSRGIKAGLVRDDVDLEAAALLLFGMIQGLVNIWALSNYKFDLTEKYSTLWKVFRKAVSRV